MTLHPPTDAGRATWAPRPVETALAAVGGLALTGVGFTVDPAGRLLVWAAAVLLFGIAAVDLGLRPRLGADRGGITVRSFGGRTGAPWAQVQVGVREHQRFGRSVATLELEVDEKLIILGRRELGADPAEVEAQLARLRVSRE